MDHLGVGKVGVDTAVFIYFIEANPFWLSVVTPLFQAADRGERELVTSAVTLLELLAVPYRTGNDALVERYEALLTRSRGIRLIDLSRDQLKRAARLRAATGVQTPDALQISAALAAGCTAFVTNDRRLPAVDGLQVLQLGSFVS